MIIAKRCFVSGRVQGVFYRASTQQEANRLGVRGYARNLADGRVEVLAVGVRQSVEQLVQRLWTASPLAEVSSVEVAEIELAQFEKLPESFRTN